MRGRRGREAVGGGGLIEDDSFWGVKDLCVF